MTIREKLALHDELEKRNADHQLSWKAGKTQTSAASIYGGRQSSPEPAAASGTGHCPAGEELINSLPAAPEEEDAQ